MPQIVLDRNSSHALFRRQILVRLRCPHMIVQIAMKRMSTNRCFFVLSTLGPGNAEKCAKKSPVSLTHRQAPPASGAVILASSTYPQMHLCRNCDTPWKLRCPPLPIPNRTFRRVRPGGLVGTSPAYDRLLPPSCQMPFKKVDYSHAGEENHPLPGCQRGQSS